MKSCLLLALFLLSLLCFAQKSKKITPPGTVKINDTLFIDKTEVANIHWREYLLYLNDIRKDSFAYEKALPDTLVWIEDSMYNYYINYYFRHPSTNNNPVTGVSYEQAVEFCNWRTFAANQADYFKEKKIKDYRGHLQDNFPVRYYYRLPTKGEWEMAALGGVDSLVSVYGGVEESFPNRCCYYNTKNYWEHINSNRKEGDKVVEFRLFSSQFLFPNKFGMYTYIGNVAEMVAEKGIAKGGSFIHNLEDCKITNNQYYTKPERWLGFRCVAVIVR